MQEHEDALLQRYLLKELESYITEQSGEITEEKLEDLAKKTVEKLVAEIPDRIYHNMKKNGIRQIKKQRREDKGFVKRNVSRYNIAFELLEFFVQYCLECGMYIYQYYRPIAAENNDMVFAALTPLHARGCLIAKEIVVLMKSGYPDGALARWRTLHEMAIICTFISKHGNETAERYILHERIIAFKGMLNYQKNCHIIGQEPYSEENVRKASEEYRTLEKRFGKGSPATMDGRKKPLGVAQITYLILRKM